jgi:hypothetical protein
VTCDRREQGPKGGVREGRRNIAEGSSRGGGAECNHYRIALGSAGECCAALDLVPLTGAGDQQTKLRRIGAMLRRLSG